MLRVERLSQMDQGKSSGTDCWDNIHQQLKHLLHFLLNKTSFINKLLKITT